MANATSAPGYLLLRQRVKGVRNEQTEGAEFVAAGLYGAIEPEDIEDVSSIFWIKAKGKTRVSQIKKHYLRSPHFETAPLPTRPELTANGKIYDDETQVKDMDDFKDGVIVFEVQDAPPLNVTSGNAFSQPPLSNTLAIQSSRKSTPTAPQRTPSIPHAIPPTSPLFEQDENTGHPSQFAARQSSESESQYAKRMQQLLGGAEYVRQMPKPSSYATPASQARSGERSSASRTPSTIRKSEPSVMGQHAQSIDEIIAEQKKEACEKLESKARSREQSPKSQRTPSAGVKPERSPQQADTPMPSARSPSPVPDRPVNDFFVSEEPQNEGVEQSEAFRGNLLQKIVNCGSLELLEDAVKVGAKILDSLEHQLPPSGNGDATHWLGQIDKLKKQMSRTRTIVGVVGNTGAGKSSVINALLDEERIVPTSCMRACTAVVTEISWNESDKPSEKYRAEIEFITQAAWEKELTALLSDFTDSDGVPLKEATMTSESDAGVAWSKMKSVYPGCTKEDFASTSSSKLASDWHVKKVLGTTKHVKDGDPISFYKSLQKYVDSVEEKENDKQKKKGEKKQMEFWPLIKCVRIYTRSDALSTGAVLVDLPGVQDSNAARAAVAESYIKQCSGLWVVAPITRAVNDKAAKQLLGDQFKRQMKFDGMVSNLTFVCSKTDDISITEAAGSLGLEDQIQEASEKKDQLKKDRSNLQADIKDYLAATESLQEAQSDLDEKIELWEGLQEDLEAGKQVLAPHEKKQKESTTNKRKRKSAPSKSRKRVSRGMMDSDDEDFIVDDDDVTESESDNDQSSDNDEGSEDEGFGEPLTADLIRKKIEGFKTSKKETREELKHGRAQIADAKRKIIQIKKDIAALESEMSAVCISGRNDYSKGRIQEDFAAGIKELDQEAAEEEDEENFNPEVDIRDYEELARSLPVFCVSSRAYQKLSGRLKKDTATPGFTSVEETGMVQLKAHCKKLTETGRLNHCKIFLNALSSLLLSLNIWGSNDGTGNNMSKEDKEKEDRVVQRMLKDLESAMDKAAKLCKDRVKESLVDNIKDQCPPAHAEAQKVALPTAQGWGSHRDSGGLYWATYKAICRRDGGPFREHDFNKALTEPLQKVLASGWEKCFQRCIPRETKALSNDIRQIIQKAHQMITKRAAERGIGVVGVDLLTQKLQTWVQLFVDLADRLNTLIMEKQRDANRELAPVICLSMQQAYTLCVEERGTGSYKRMKDHMISHLNNMVHTMYPQATKTVWARLEAMFLEVSKELEREKDAIYDSMYKDYMNVLCGTQIDGMMPKWERMMRGAVGEEVGKTDELFQKLLDGVPLDEILGKADQELAEEAKDDEQNQKEDGPEAMDAEAVVEKQASVEPGHEPVKAELSTEDVNASLDDIPMTEDNDESGDFRPKEEAAEVSTLSAENEMEVDA